MADIKIKTQNQQLADYIKKNIAKGYTADSLKFSLINQGYGRTAVERAIDTANQQLAAEAPKMIEKPQITYTALGNGAAKKEEPGFFKRLWAKFVS